MCPRRLPEGMSCHKSVSMLILIEHYLDTLSIPDSYLHTSSSKPNGIHLSIIDDMNFSQEIYLVIGVLRSFIYNLTINQHCAWVP
jgi:hypothetical protein